MNKFFIALLLSCITYSSFAQQAPTQKTANNFTLQDCINYGYEHQDTVKNAKLDVLSADYKVKETIGIGLPQINGSVSFQDYIKTPSIIFPDFISSPIYAILSGNNVKNSVTNTVIPSTPPQSNAKPNSVSLYQKYSNNIGVTLNQIIFDGSYIIGLKASRTYKQLYERSLIRSKIDARINITKAYYQVLVSNEQIKLLDADLNQLKQQVEQTEASNKQGFVEKIDVDRIKFQLNNLTTTKENIERLLVLNYQLLKFQIGMPVNEDLTLKDKLEDLNLAIDPSDNVDTAFYHNRIEYNLFSTNLELNKLDLKRKKSQFLPSLMFVANAGDQFQNNNIGQLYSNNYLSSYVGLNLNIPIFNGFQRKYQVKETQINVVKAQNDLDNLKNALTLQANSAKITYINSLKSLENQKQNQALAQEVLRVTKIKYQQGVGSSIEVTQAQTALEDADNKYIQSLYDVLINKVDLDKAYGKLN